MYRYVTCLVVVAAAAAQQGTESFLGNLAPVIRSIHEEHGFAFEYARRGSLSHAEWRRQARAKVQEFLAYRPRPVPLDLRVHSVVPREGYEIRIISFAGSAHYRIPAFLPACPPRSARSLRGSA